MGLEERYNMTTDPDASGVRLENLCPHPVTAMREDGTIFVLPTSRNPARITVTPGPRVSDANGVAIHGPPIYGQIVHLPQPEPGVIYVVSQIVALALAARGARRGDVVFPGSGPHDGPHRDHRGRILAVTRLVRTS
ncbi:hypothetical protein [Falsiroseomonas sp. CW058]|uniref:hypothetical protein n=1 Tax=Falsiroseomonas sp. CW058 TaxID=3388664 RepID=UPI003D323F0F